MEFTSIGDRIVLTDNCSQTFEGEVKSLNKDLGRILLTNVVQQPGNIALEGYRHFDKDEILKIRKNECKKSIECLIENKEKPSNGTSESFRISPCKYNEIKKLQREYQYINKLNANFHVAISLLQQCDIIGLCVKEVSKGRYERASVMSISTNTNIFIFDLQILGDSAFEKGLRKILESSEIVKVVHDARFLSDCLKHKHLVDIKNIRDVEAEDIMIVHQERKIIRNHSRSLRYLVKIYLNADMTDCNISEETWNQRPLPVKMLEFLVCFVSFLIPLQEMIEKKFLQRLIDASNVYNTCVRDSDLFDFLQFNPENTLRKNMIEIVRPKNYPRTENCRSLKN